MAVHGLDSATEVVQEQNDNQMAQHKILSIERRISNTTFSSLLGVVDASVRDHVRRLTLRTVWK